MILSQKKLWGKSSTPNNNELLQDVFLFIIDKMVDRSKW